MPGKNSALYSKIEYQTAVNAKKQSLEMQMNLLNMMNSINNYNRLRKKETVAKLKLKNNLKEIRIAANSILNNLPNIPHEEKRVIKQKAEKRVIKQKSTRIEDELR